MTTKLRSASPLSCRPLSGRGAALFTHGQHPTRASREAGDLYPLSIATPPMGWDPLRLASLLHELDRAPTLFCVRRLIREHAHELPETTRADLLEEQRERRGEAQS